MTDFDGERWLTERLGESVSANVRDIVRQLVLEGDWFFDDMTAYKITMVRRDNPCARQTLEVWLQNRHGTMGFGSATHWVSVAEHPRLELIFALQIARDMARRPS